MNGFLLGALAIGFLALDVMLLLVGFPNQLVFEDPEPIDQEVP